MPRLWHRWFVEHNPLYLFSAALVLSGMWLLSREAAEHGSAVGFLGVAAVAEVYSFALIGAAALLVRRGVLRPAVMLGLIAACYQGDLTLHVETCAFLGGAGIVASIVWLALFVGKLHALAAALRLRLSCSAFFVPTLGAIGLAALPHAFREVDVVARSQLVAIWAFAVGAAALYTCRRVESRLELDVRGRRALHATWLIWAFVALGHFTYWVAEFQVAATAVLPAAALLSTRLARRELAVWSVAAATLAAVAVLVPHSLALTALMAAVTLALRALRWPYVGGDAAPPELDAHPYRQPPAAPPDPARSVAYALAPRPARLRLLLGTASCTHLALWTPGFHGGVWPDHSIPLDLALLVLCAVVAFRVRRPIAIAPVVPVALHYAIGLGLVGAPTGTLEWGLVLLAIGFAALAAAVVQSVRSSAYTLELDASENGSRVTVRYPFTSRPGD